MLNTTSHIYYKKFSFNYLLKERDKEIHEEIKKISVGCFDDHITYIIYNSYKELTTNALKANLKRAMFLENKLNILNSAEYKKGMDLFINGFQNLSEIEKQELYKKNNLFVEVDLIKTHEVIQINIFNNTCLTSFEEKMVRKKLTIGSQYDNLSEVFSLVEESVNEGAGLGIIMILILLKSIGLTPRHFSLNTEFERGTIAQVIFPYKSTFKLDR